MKEKNQKLLSMREQIIKILNKAVLAPSGDNSQPWKFKIDENSIQVWLIPNADDSVYNFQERGSFISVGAVIENIVQLADSDGLSVDLKMFPNPAELYHLATINLANGERKPSLGSYIEARTTNRKTYKPEKIKINDREELLKTPVSEVSQFQLLEEPEKIVKMAEYLSNNERLMLENYHIHQKLFSFIRWTSEEEQKTQTGLYIKTLELQPPQEKAFKLFSKWPVINFFNIFSIAKLVSNDTQKLYASTPAYGMLTINDYSSLNLVNVGRVLQRIWLTATKLGLSLQPVAAILYLAQRINAGDKALFTQNQAEIILESETKIKEAFNLQGSKPAMMFRIGYSDPPSARSLKRNPIIE